ncbi:MAG TPA: hypothetical protein VHH34_08565 [Pseudonocardiaceae bacterium]|nr:hypothetical protein [Pseudonocardiaceae bacterium]
MTPAPAEDRHDRIELIWSPHGGSERPGWTLYVDGLPVANTTADLLHAAAQQWAQARLGQAVTWRLGAPCWYFLAHPCQAGEGAR